MKTENTNLLAENGLIRDRNINEARAEHLKEIVATRIDFMKKQDIVQAKIRKIQKSSVPCNLTGAF